MEAFFVKKKGGALRLIIDARGVNRMCRPSPAVSLATPESLSFLEAVSAGEIATATVDVRDAFRRVRLVHHHSCFSVPSQ